MIFLQCLFQSTIIQRHPDTALILCRSYQAEALHATVSEGLAKVPYVAARVGSNLHAALRTESAEISTEPPRSISPSS